MSRFTLPRDIYYGANALENLKTLKGTRAVLVLGGGIGNLIDRIAEGRVVDYINLLFMRFAVFNFADICVCVGMGLWILAIILEERRNPEGKK